MKNKIIIFVFIIATFTIFSCKKKCDSPAPINSPAASKTSLLINKNWQKILHTETIGNEAPKNIFSTLKDCEKDNWVTFSAISNDASSGTLNFKINVKSNIDEADKISTWYFNTDQSEIILDGESLKILELTNILFKVSGSETINGIATIQLITFGVVN